MQVLYFFSGQNLQTSDISHAFIPGSFRVSSANGSSITISEFDEICRKYSSNIHQKGCKISGRYLQYFVRYTHLYHSLVKNRTKSHLQSYGINGCISENTAGIVLKFCTLSGEYLMNTSCNFHQILRW